MEVRQAIRGKVVITLAAAVSIITAAFGVLTNGGVPTAHAAQSVPYLVNFQGRLTDNNGNILTDGSYNIKFRIMSASTGGTNLWEGDRVYGASDYRVQVVSGLFNIQFGDTTKGDPALSPALFNTQTNPNLYLEVELPTPATATCASNGCASFTEGAMTPRQPLASTPYAFNSDTLDGLDATDFAQLSGANTFTGASLFAPTTASTVALTVKATTAGGTNSLEVFDSSGVRQGFFSASGALNLSQAISAPTATNTINGVVINAGALSAVTGYTQGSGTFNQTLSSATATNATNFNYTLTNAGAGVAMQGINITPTNTTAASSGTNVLNLINFAAGGALLASDNTNGLNFASATGYTNFINTPTTKLTSAGAFTGVPSITVTTTTATALVANTVTTGIAVSATGLTTSVAANGAFVAGGANTTTGVGYLFNTTANAATTPKAVNITGAAAAVTADVSGALINVTPTRTLAAAATRNDAMNFMNLSRSITTSIAGSVYNITGALANLQSNCTQTLGTCNDSSSLLNLNQQYATASGAVLNVQSAGTGNLASLDASNAGANGVAIDVQSSGTGQYVMRLTSNNAATNVLFARADGRVGIGNAAPASALDVTGTANATAYSVGGTAGSTAACTGGQVLVNPTLTNGILTAGACGTPSGTGAATDLSNLTTTAINQSLLPNANNSFDLGSVTAAWNDVFATNVDAGTTTTALTIGTANATSIQLGKTGLQVSIPGGVSSSGNITTSGNLSTTGTGVIQTGGSTRLDQNGALSNITGYIQGSGTFSLTSTTASGNIFAVADAALNTNGANLANFSFTNTNTTASAIATNGIQVVPTGTANSNANANTLNAFSAGNATAANNNTINALNIGTGYTNYVNATNLVINASGDITTNFTQLDGSTTTNGTGANSTSMTVTSSANFNIGNYLRLANSAACTTGGPSTCYAKITNIAGNVLTITPALTWATGRAVVEFHIPEMGGTDVTQTLTNRYGRGYFISGVATGNGTTYYNEDGIETSASDFSLVPTVTNLTIGSAATTVAFPGSVTVAGQSIVNGSGQINGAQLQTGTVANGALANSTIGVTAGTGLSGGGTPALGGTTSLSVNYGSTSTSAVRGDTTLVCPSGSGNLSGTGNTITLGSGGTCNALSTVNNPTFSTSVTTPSIGASGALNIASGGTSALTLNSLSGNLGMGANTSAIQKTGAAFSLDVANGASASTLSVTNSGAGVASLNVEGGVTIGSGTAITVGASTGQSSTVSCSANQAVTAATFTGGVLTAAPSCATINGTGATTTLNNVASTSIGADLLPSANNTRSLGSAALVWAHMYAADIDAGTTTTALTVGTAATTTAVTVGRSGLQVSVPGGVSSSGNITTTGNLSTTGTGVIQTGGSTRLDQNGALSNITGITQTSGTVSQTYSTATAGTAHSISVTDTQTAGAGVTVQGLSLTPANANPASGTNTINLMNFAAGSGTSGTAVTNGLNFASATGYTNFFNSPSAVLSSAGAWTGLTGVTLASGSFSGSGASLTNLNPTNLAQGSGAVTLQSAAATAVNITSNGNSTWQTTGTGTLGVTSAGAMTVTSGGNAIITAGANTLAVTSSNFSVTTGGSMTVTQAAGNTATITAGTTVPTADQFVVTNTGSTGPTTADINLVVLQYKGGNAAVESSAERIELQPGTTSGGVWSGTRVVQNATGPATGVTTNGAKFDGPTAGGAGTYNAINIGAGATTTGGTARGINITGANSQAAGTIQGININNITGGAGATENAIVLGTGWDALLTYNGGTLISGTGVFTGNGSGLTTLNASNLAQGSGAVTLQSAAATAANITSNAAATWQTTAGLLTITGTGGTTISTGAATNISLAPGTTGQVSIGGTTPTITSTGTLAIDSNGTSALNIGAGANGKAITVGNTTTGTRLNLQAAVNTTTSGTNGVGIGSATTDANQVNFQLDSSNVFAETASTCSTTVNQGALYYNTVTNATRACINGGWEDLVSTAGMGLIAFGVLPDSSNAGAVGDLAGVAGYANSPCKVYWTATQQVTVAPCTAFSGGRKVIIPSTAISTAGLAANAYGNICLDGTNNQPQLKTGNATENLAAVPTWNQGNPVLCLATVRASATAGNVGFIYDLRTYTTTQKSFATINAAVALGVTVAQDTNANLLRLPTAAAVGGLRGVVVGYSGAASSTTANVIIATAGPQWVKATGTSAVNSFVQAANTSGYTQTAAIAATGYAFLGVSTRTIDTACASGTCQYSQFLNPMSIR